ncbi:hypothetical protein FH972_019767 [Carpinus fangiana]|uniref:Uncharacterized protein n=1 Tax=Carpinus fangiana TaxID=176857 RepID=A0A5N6RRA5_9ROSI|nr:hypothetical protein FH972_019767 [Carpinus fangiana]
MKKECETPMFIREKTAHLIQQALQTKYEKKMRIHKLHSSNMRKPKSRPSSSAAYRVRRYLELKYLYRTLKALTCINSLTLFNLEFDQATISYYAGNKTNLEKEESTNIPIETQQEDEGKA